MYRCLIKTKSYYYVGDLIDPGEEWYDLKNVTLIASTGDYHNFINRTEPYNSDQSEVKYFNYPKEKIVSLLKNNIIEMTAYDIQFN